MPKNNNAPSMSNKAYILPYTTAGLEGITT